MTDERFRPPVIAVVGPTGTGKSELSLRIAEVLSERERSSEVVGADAMQLYRGMDIGTAKLTVEERRGVPHHLIDVLEPHEEATVAAYQRDARQAITEIQARQSVPILVGGSGLYVNAALYDFRFPGADPHVRADLERQLEQEGLATLVRELTAVDPQATETVDLKNPRRVVRALEVLRVTGRPIAEALPESPKPIQPTIIVGVREERSVLVERLDARVERMWADGILQETEALLTRGLLAGATASRAIGYAQAAAQIDGRLTEAEAVRETQALTRRYARRQMSWFKRLPDVEWIRSGDLERLDTVQSIAARWGACGAENARTAG